MADQDCPVCHGTGEDRRTHGEWLACSECDAAEREYRETKPEPLSEEMIERITQCVVRDPVQYAVRGVAYPDPQGPFVAGDDYARCEAAKNAAYRERDRLVAALSKLFPAWLERHPESDKAWEDDWRWIVFVEIPTTDPTVFGDARNVLGPCRQERAQLSWHIHDSELSWFDHLERRAGPSWDGHTTEEKYRRLSAIRASRAAAEARGR